jgi:hypothetical protein
MSHKFRASTQPGLEVYHDESNGAGLNNNTFSNHNHSISSDTANSNQQYKPTSALHPSQSHPSSPIYDPAGLEVDQTGNNAQWDAKRRAAMEVKNSSPVKGYPAGQYANRYRERRKKEDSRVDCWCFLGYHCTEFLVIGRSSWWWNWWWFSSTEEIQVGASSFYTTFLIKRIVFSSNNNC